MYTDPGGESIFTIIFILVATSLIGTGIGIKHAYDTGKEGWDFVKDVIIGFGLGLAAGGLIVSGWAAIKGSLAVLGWISNATVWGVEAQKAFAIGLLAYDFTAIIIAPVVGLELEPIEMGGDKPYQFPKPEETPKHPFLKRHRRSGTLFGFSMNGII